MDIFFKALISLLILLLVFAVFACIDLCLGTDIGGSAKVVDKYIKLPHITLVNKVVVHPHEQYKIVVDTFCTCSASKQQYECIEIGDTINIVTTHSYTGWFTVSRVE